MTDGRRLAALGAALLVLASAAGCSSESEGDAGSQVGGSPGSSPSASTTPADPDESTDSTQAASDASDEAGAEETSTSEPSDSVGTDERTEEKKDNQGRAGGEPTLGPGGDQTDLLSKLDGSAEPGCVNVGGSRDVRSGSFAAGPFDDAKSAWTPGNLQVRLYFIPQDAGDMPGVTVTGRNLDDGATISQTQNEVGDADQFAFYDMQLALSTAGTWELKADAGGDSGCWRVTFGS